jgi:hypothetical protein
MNSITLPDRDLVYVAEPGAKYYVFTKVRYFESTNEQPRLTIEYVQVNLMDLGGNRFVNTDLKFTEYHGPGINTERIFGMQTISLAEFTMLMHQFLHSLPIVPPPAHEQA